MTNKKHLFVLAGILSIVFSKARADSYEDFTATIERSHSAASFAITRPLVGYDESTKAKVEISVYTRLRLNAEQLLPEAVLPEALQSGQIRNVATETLSYEPTIIRLSDEHLAVFDRYGTNREWLKAHGAIMVKSFAGKTEFSIPLNAIISDIESCNFLSESRVSWLKDAWFSIDGTCLFVALWLKQSTQPESYKRLLQVNLVDCSIVQLGEIEYINVIRRSEPRFQEAIFDVAREGHCNVLVDFAKAMFSDKSTGVSRRAHAAAYLFSINNDEESLTFLNSLEAQLKDGKYSQSTEMIVSGSYYEDPFAFACQILRANASSLIK